MKLLLKLVFASTLTLNLFANTLITNARSTDDGIVSLSSLISLNDFESKENQKNTDYKQTGTKNEQTSIKQELSIPSEGPKDIISSAGYCGAIHKSSIYDFDNGGDSLNASSRGLCNIGASLQSFTFNTNSHTRNRVCTAKGKKQSSLCGAQELFCGDGLINGVNTNTPQARLVSKNLTTNEAANGISYIPSISQNGDFAVFNSVASNLVAGDSYGYKDVFLYNKKLKTLKNITINGNYHSRWGSITADGRYVVFESEAANLVPNDTNAIDIFIYDVKTDTIEKILSGANRVLGYAIVSPDGRYIAFESNATNLVPNDTDDYITDIFVYDRYTSTTKKVTIWGDAPSSAVSVSNDGHVAFQSNSSTRISNGSDTNGQRDVFLYDNQTSSIKRITNWNFSSQSVSISADGRYTTFQSLASNLVASDWEWNSDIFVYDNKINSTKQITNGKYQSWDPSISADGRYITFQSNSSDNWDTNGVDDIFVYDKQINSTKRITNEATASTQPSISADGRYLTYMNNNQVYMILIGGLEQCDDGNMNNNDACNNQCTTNILPWS